MKNLFYFIFVLIIISDKTKAQAPLVSWAKSMNGDNYEYLYHNCVDPSGNVYQAGITQSTQLHMGTITLQNPGTSSMFVAKYNGVGTELWCKIITSGPGEIDECTTDANGNVFVCGTIGYSNQLTYAFDTVMVTANGMAAFVAKYDSSGNLLWVRKGDGTSNDQAYALGVDHAGNCIIAGYYYSDSLSFGTNVLTNSHPGYASMFLVKYDTSGTVLWAQKFEGNNSNVALSLAVDLWDEIFVTGYTYSDNVTFGNSTISNYGSDDMFLFKYTSTGIPLWAQNAGGPDIEKGVVVLTDQNGSAFVMGDFNSPNLNFNSLSLSNTNQIIASADIYYCKYDSGGYFMWAKQFTGSSEDDLLTACIDNSGNIYLGGDYYSDTLFSGTHMILNHSTNADIWFAKVDPNGNSQWMQGIGTTDFEDVYGMACDNMDNLYVSGEYYGNSVTFGTSTLNNQNVLNGSDIYVVKYDVTTGLPKESFNNFSGCSPNPFSSYTTVHLAEGEKINSLCLYDIFGKKILSCKNINANRFNIERNNLTSGVYLLKIESVNEVTYSQKIIIE